MKIHMRENHKDDIRIVENELETNLPDNSHLISYINDKGYLMVVFTNYTLNTDVEIFGVASGKWFHPDIYQHIFYHCFNTLGCKRVTLKVENDNHKCINLIEKGGAVLECKLRGLNILLYSLLPSDITIMSKDNGKETKAKRDNSSRNNGVDQATTKIQ